ncbi:MAG: GGDEF domain-containing protein [Sphingopyxis sp.]|uniref:GGDEF domain-containing protein n=1 Tax=Sphingopyxis sp. TaxID=1908224 RepID=UPI003D811960
MTAAYILIINMIVAAIFAIAFAVVAATRASRGAKWLALGYASGILVVLLEFLLPHQADPTPVGIGIFLIFLLALTFCLVGIARHYRAPLPAGAMAAIWIVGLLAVPLIFSLPYGTPQRGIFYQLAYFSMQALCAVVVVRARRRQPLDLLLIVLLVVAATIYLAKPLIAWSVGTASAPQGYMATTYAAISQSLGAVTLVALALVVLLVMMRDTAAEMSARLDTDVLSGVFNRRGFDDRAERAIAAARRGGRPAVLIAADLDHFKAINDRFGHAAGDSVIAGFARLLVATAPEGAIVSRLGGEEFAVLIAGADLASGRRYAEAVRATFAATPPAGLDRMVSASFGVAQLIDGDTLFDLARRADAALYRAKAGGRDQVRWALGETAQAPSPAKGTIR